MTQTAQPGNGAQEDRRRALILLFLGLGAGSGVAAGLLDYSEIFFNYGAIYPVPFTDFEFFIGSSVIFPGVIFGLAVGIALYLLGFADTDKLTSFALASTLASVVAANTGYYVAKKFGLSDTTGEFWVLEAAVDGPLSAVILATAAAVLFTWCRKPRRWVMLVFAGGAAGGLGAWAVFGWIDDAAFAEAGSNEVYWAWLVYMAIFYGAFGAALGAFVPTGPWPARETVRPANPGVRRKRRIDRARDQSRSALAVIHL